MRNLFIVAAKILGLFQFAAAFQKLPVSSFLMWRHESFEMLLHNLFIPLLLIAFAFVLVFKTAWLADKVGLADKTESPTLNRDDLLAAGLKLLGLYFAILFAQCVLLMLGFLLQGMLGSRDPTMHLFGTSIFSFTVMFIFSVLFIFRTNAVMTMLTLAESAPWRKVVVATLVVLAAILVLTTLSTLDAMKRSRAFYSQDNPMWNEKEIHPTVEYTIP